MKKSVLFLLGCFAFITLTSESCEVERNKTQTNDKTGITETYADVKTGSDGLTVEQRNIKERIEIDNKVGTIKHLYVISSFSGDVILYSTVDGKVTSSGKRLTNTHRLVNGDGGQYSSDYVMPSIQDDGTYGSSTPYLYWWDSKGVYHQHYVTGGQILHISDQPVSVPKVIINLENTK